MGTSAGIVRRLNCGSPRLSLLVLGPLRELGPAIAHERAITLIMMVDDIARPVLHLIENQPDVFADHAEKEELNAADEADSREEGRPPGHLEVAEKIDRDLDDCTQDAQGGHDASGADAEAQRDLRKRTDAIDGKIDER